MLIVIRKSVRTFYDSPLLSVSLFWLGFSVDV